MKRLLVSMALAVAVHGWFFGLELPVRQIHVQPPRPKPVVIELTALPIHEPPPDPPPEPPPPPPPEPRPAPKPPKPKPAPQLRPIEPPIAAVAADPQPVEPVPDPPPPRPQPAPSTVAVPVPAPVLVQARPRYRDNPAPAYPNLARRRGLEGTVVLEVLVGVDGRVKGLKIAESSGHGLLDEAAVSSVKTWSFEPGKRGDHPLEMWVRVPVAFVLN